MATETAANIMDGKHIAECIRREVLTDVEEMIREVGQSPKLVVILVGDRKDSSTYVNMKEKACKECKIESVVVRCEANVTELELIGVVDKLNADPSVDGILVQLPLPRHISEERILDCIHHSKDVDGLSCMNMGALTIRGREPLFYPCTAEGCLELCKRYGVELFGKNVVVIGRSNIVGIPVSLMMQQEDATVTMCHSRTQNLQEVCSKADVVVAAVGKSEMVKAQWIKEGAVVIDVGINSVDDSTRKSGYRLVGDVDFEGCKSKCRWITPVPGGVGPMTVAILIRNTLKSRNLKLFTDKDPSATL